MTLQNALCTLLAWPSRKRVLKLRVLSHRYHFHLLRDNGPYIAEVSEVNSFTNAAITRITTNFKQEVRDYVYTFMYLEEYTLTEIIAASILAALVKETPRAAQAAKKNSTTAKMNMIASESCI